MRVLRISLDELFTRYIDNLIDSVNGLGVVVAVFVELALPLRIVDERWHRVVGRQSITDCAQTRKGPENNINDENIIT